MSSQTGDQEPQGFDELFIGYNECSWTVNHNVHQITLNQTVYH